MKITERYKAIIEFFEANMPNPETELHYENSFQLLVAVVLSAQCTDVRVNIVTPNLFARYNSIEQLSVASFDDLFAIIKSISYPNNKAKHLIAMANMLLTDFNGSIPMTVEELIKLPGVGRKTANVITSVIDKQPNMAVDTHVFRLSHRIGLVSIKAKTPFEVEKQLIKQLPQKLIHKAHHWLILHGRYVCIARNPKCQECGITAYCKYFAEQQKLVKK